jgi:hypothetical protein
MEVIPAREFNELFVWIDIAFIVSLAIILYFTKRYVAAIVGLLGGVLYFIVDYGIFYLALGTRIVGGADTFWLLLWMSMSYGFTNFVWIWLWLDRDKRTFEWSTLILAGWLCVALLSQNFGASFGTITTTRGTGSYHGVMALIMFVGYAILVVKNIRGEREISIPWILAIGVLVQFAWEGVLLVTGIRSLQTMPIIINSLIETNLGLPYLFLTHRAVMSRRNEDLTLKTVLTTGKEALQRT